MNLKDAVALITGCKRRRENPSLKRPAGPAAPELKSGSRRPSAKMGRGRRDERRGTVRAGAASGVCAGAEPARGSAALRDRPADGGEDAGVLGAAGVPAGPAAGAAEAGSVYRDHRSDPGGGYGTAGQAAAYLEADFRAA